MPGISQILQAVFIFITMILLTFAFFSTRIFSSKSKRYILIAGTVITALSLFFLESLINHYLLRFYHYAGWNGYVLYLFLFFVLVSPFIPSLYRIVTGLKFKVKSPHTAAAISGITKENITVKNETPGVSDKQPLKSEIETLQKPELPANITEAPKDIVKIESEIKKHPAVKKRSTARKRTASKKNAASNKKTNIKKNPGGENAKN